MSVSSRLLPRFGSAGCIAAPRISTRQSQARRRCRHRTSWRMSRCDHTLYSSGKPQRQKGRGPYPVPLYRAYIHPHVDTSFQTEDAGCRPDSSPCLCGRAHACRTDPATGDCTEGAPPRPRPCAMQKGSMASATSLMLAPISPPTCRRCCKSMNRQGEERGSPECAATANNQRREPVAVSPARPARRSAHLLQAGVSERLVQ